MRLRRPFGAAVLLLAIGAAACGSSGNGLPAAGTGTPQAAVSGFIGNLPTDVSAACGYVVPSQQAQCNKTFAGGTFSITSPSIGQSSVDGNEALVVVLSTNSCTGLAGSTSICNSNTNASAGLPSSQSDFATAFQATFASNATAVAPCIEFGGVWYVELAPGGTASSSATGATGNTGTTTSGPTGNTGGGTTTSGPTGTTGSTSTSGPTGTTGGATTTTIGTAGNTGSTTTSP
jgi:hypothetical protein